MADCDIEDCTELMACALNGKRLCVPHFKDALTEMRKALDDAWGTLEP